MRVIYILQICVQCRVFTAFQSIQQRRISRRPGGLWSIHNSGALANNTALPLLTCLMYLLQSCHVTAKPRHHQHKCDQLCLSSGGGGDRLFLHLQNAKAVPVLPLCWILGHRSISSKRFVSGKRTTHRWLTSALRCTRPVSGHGRNRARVTWRVPRVSSFD